MNQRDALANVFIVMGPLCLGLIICLMVASSYPEPFNIAAIIGMYAVGLAFVVAAKFSVFRQKRFLTFGSGLMSQDSRRLYRQGYGLMILAAFLTLQLLATERRLTRVAVWHRPPDGNGRR